MQMLQLLKRLIKTGNKKIVLISGTEISPSTQNAIVGFKAKYGGVEMPSMDAAAQVDDAVLLEGQDAPVMPEMPEGNVIHVQYDAVSYNGIREANLESFGQRAIPDYDFSKAKVIVFSIM